MSGLPSKLDFVRAVERFKEVAAKHEQVLNSSPELLLMLRSTYKKIKAHQSVIDWTEGPTAFRGPLNYYGIRIETFDSKASMGIRAVELFNAGIKFAIVNEEEPSKSGEE